MEFKYIKQVLDFMEIEYIDEDKERLYIPRINLHIHYWENEKYYSIYKEKLYMITSTPFNVMNEIMKNIK